MTQRRQQAKDVMRSKIMTVGLQMFAERGFDHVTVDDIAEAAGAAPITVFRHFGTKDGIVFSSRVAVSEALRAAAEAAAADPDPRRVVAETLLAFVGDTAGEDDLWQVRSAIIAGSTHLQLLSHATRVELEQVLILALSARNPPGSGLATRVAAAAGLTAFHMAVRQWREVPAGPLSAVFLEALDALWPDLGLRT